MKLDQGKIAAQANLPKTTVMECIHVVVCVVAKSIRFGHLKKLLGKLLLMLEYIFL